MRQAVSKAGRKMLLFLQVKFVFLGRQFALIVALLMVDRCKNCQLSSFDQYLKTICLEENNTKYLQITEITSKMVVTQVIVKLSCSELQIQIFQTSLNAALLI